MKKPFAWTTLAFAAALAVSGLTPTTSEAQPNTRPTPQTLPIPSPSPAVSLIESSKGVFLRLRQNWRVAKQYRNATELVVPAGAEQAGVMAARMLVTTEPRRSHEEAVRRLAEIAAEYEGETRYLEIDGWPAVERVYTAPLPVRGKGQQDQTTTAREEVNSMRVTTAIAVADTVVRYETTFAPRADRSLAEAARAIGRSTTTLLKRNDRRQTEREIEMLRAMPRPETPRPDNAPRQLVPPRQLGLLRDRDVLRERDALLGRARAGRDARPDAAPGAAALVHAGVGEIEVAASNDGQNVVIAANSGFSNSTDGGATYTFRGGTPATFPRDGDPSLAFGLSGAFYYGFIAFPNGSAAAGGVTGCSTGVSVSTDNGATFPFRSHAVLCPQTGPGLCFPDQEHIAADRVNAAPGGGDQVYSVWRNFTSASATTCGGITSGSVTMSIVCSQDSGTTWTAPAVIAGAGDFPRVTVGPDGMVYAVYRAGSSIMLNKYSSCGAGLVQQVGFPVTVATFNNVVCPLAGLDRCNGPNILTSPTAAVDDTNPAHVYVAYATNTAAGNENVIVTDSTDGGATWPRSVIVNAPAVSARRFMPWVCATGGTAHVSWYDRRAATATSTDLTDFYLGSASVQGGNLVAGPEFNLSVNADPQCATGFPCGASSALTNACSAAPSPGGGCPKYGDYNGIACAANRVFAAWASGTTPPGVPAGTGLRVFTSTVGLSNFYVRDWNTAATGDDGTQPSTNPNFYTTSDVWNRHTNAPGPLVGGVPETHDALAGTGTAGDNFMFARVRRNAGLASGATDVRAHFLASNYGLGRPYVDVNDMDPDITMSAPDPVLTFGPGDTGPLTTAGYPWHLGPTSSPHVCIAVEISAPGDQFVAPSLRGFAPGWPTTDLKIIDDNNKAQRNLGVTTTPITGAGGAALSYYAIAHNAATFPRDMTLAYEVPRDSLGRLDGAAVEVVGGRPLKVDAERGGRVVLENMQPGENRWFALTFVPPAGKEGELLGLNFYEMVDGHAVNGLFVGAQPAPPRRIARDALQFHRAVFTRMRHGFRIDAAGGEADFARAELSRPDDSLTFCKDYEGCRVKSVDAAVRLLVESQKSADPFGILDSLRVFDASARRGDAGAATVAHATLLNKLDAFMTMQQLAKGDAADIIQNVRWQRDLYARVPVLAKLQCSASLRDASEKFISAYGQRQAHNRDYPALLGGLSRCFADTARAAPMSSLGLERNLDEMRQSAADPAALQKAHRDYLLKLQSLKP